MAVHHQSRESLLRDLCTDPTQGLSRSQADALRARIGENRQKEKKRRGLPARFLEQFRDVMILILLAAAAVSFVLACLEQNPRGFIEPCLILLIVLLNALMGVLQESRAERALEALRRLSAPHAKVLREGVEQLVEASSLVPGDIIRLEAGDLVPADARLLRSASLRSEESALTGESVPSEKSADATVSEEAPLGDRSNMVFSGCSITYGSALAVVTATGMRTEMGRIAHLLEREEERGTPLQARLARLGRTLGILAILVCGVILAIGLANRIPAIEIFMTSISLAVSAIPEGLPAIVTVVLSIGVSRMAKRNALIRRLPAVETLGSASVICSDKTGTLTQNRMTLVRVYPDGAEEGEEIGSDNSARVRRLLELATLCCDGTVRIREGEAQHVGDPTETAIVYAAHRNGILKEELNAAFPRQAELPFDSERKRMTTVCRRNGKSIVIVKGAFDLLAPLCSSGDLKRAGEACERMGGEALRVLALAYKEMDTLPKEINAQSLENELHFAGLLGMIDPPRPEVRDAVALCRRAGIRPVMITGDHVVTAGAIARELGILREGERAVTGVELDAMSEEALDAAVEAIAVYARVSPENKLRIVKAWQRRGQVVAMTGDGINDAPALKAADIGCAMGITGTDVAKGAADMTLTDDNFSTIVEAVREGRGIYANIRKVVEFLLGTNVGEVITVFASMLLWHKSPLLSIQLLWINLVTDSLPAIALGMEALPADVMEQPPRPRDEGILAGGLGVRVVLQGGLFALLTLIGFYFGERAAGIAGGQTLAFMVLSLSQIVHAFNMRSEHSLLRIGFFGNRTLNLAALLSGALTALLLLTPVGGLFSLVLLPRRMLLLGLVLVLSPFAVIELSKGVLALLARRCPRRR